MLHSTDQQKCILYPKDKLLGHFIWRKKRLHDLSIHVPEKTHSYENHTYPPSQIKATFTLVFEKMCWSVTQWNLVSERKLDRQKLCYIEQNIPTWEISFHTIFHFISTSTGLQTILLALPCHKDFKTVLRSEIRPWEVGEKIGQTDRKTDKMTESKLREF